MAGDRNSKIKLGTTKDVREKMSIYMDELEKMTNHLDESSICGELAALRKELDAIFDSMTDNAILSLFKKKDEINIFLKAITEAAISLIYLSNLALDIGTSEQAEAILMQIKDYSESLRRYFETPDNDIEAVAELTDEEIKKIDRSIMNKDIFVIRDELIASIIMLEGLTKELGDNTTAVNLYEQRLRLQHGLVRVAFVGMTNAGKSTMVNAYMGEIIVPENPSTSSPIPVWMGYHDKSAEIHILKDNGELQKIEPLKFRKSYCYNTAEQVDNKRSRFVGINWATVMTNNPLLKKGATLIDTLGIGAGPVDDAKTVAVLHEGVDIVVYISKELILEKDEIFIRENILGNSENSSRHFVEPENLIFVYNNHSTNPCIMDDYCNSIKRLFVNNGKLFSQDRFSYICSNNVLEVNALNARLRDVGVFPYVENIPYGNEHDERRVKAMKTREESEQKRLEMNKYNAYSGESSIEELKTLLQKKVDHLLYGNTSVAKQRISEIKKNVVGLIAVAQKRIESANLSKADALKIIQEIERIKDDLDTEGDKIGGDIKLQRVNLQKSISKMFTNVLGESVFRGCIGVLERNISPPESLPRAKDFNKMTEMERVETIKPFIEPIIYDCLKNMGEVICRDIWVDSLDENIVTPKDCIKQTRNYLMDHSIILNQQVKQMEKANISLLGIMLPSTETFDNMCSVITANAEKGIMEMFLVYKDSTAWESVVKENINNVKAGFWGALFGMSNEKFWLKVLDELVFETVKLIFKEAFFVNKESSVKDSIVEAYVKITLELQRVYDRLSSDVEREIALVSHRMSLSELAREKDMIRLTEIIAICKKMLTEFNNNIAVLSFEEKRRQKDVGEN